ncbi:unnamed protein product [Rotaria sordida]|uniref:Uncharacterized protein n=1 Tax=Rotaria sordida TaxID=392033 RepID=A0A818XAH3_9BILA|nr:unnamed protein product [Rotaria sordida]
MGCSLPTCVSLNIQANVVQPQPLKISNNKLNQLQTTRFIENSLIIWLADQSLIEEENLLNQFRHVISTLRIFTDSVACFTFINNIHNEKIFLIISPEYEQFINRIHHLPQIFKIYIFDLLSQMVNNTIFQSNIFRNMIDLCNQLREDRELCELDCISITTIVPLSSDEVSVKRNAAFLIVQLTKEVISRYKFENDAKSRFADFCRIHYADNDEQLRAIDDFETTYRPQKALYWLIRPYFISRILNRIQRTIEVDILYKISFLMKHIHVQLVNFYDNINSPSKQISWIVYRGKTMLNDEFDMLLRNSSGGFLSSSCFLMASTDKNIAIDFLRRLIAINPQRIAILFEIHIDATKHAMSPFALLEDSNYEIQSTKDNICFTFSTVFRIESIEQINDFSIVMWIVKLILVDDSDSQLFHLIEPLHSNEVQVNPLAYAGKLSIDMGNFDHAEQFYLQLLDDQSILNQPRRYARVQSSLGYIFTLKNELSKALEHYQQALEANLSCLQPDHPDLISIYRIIGDCYSKTSNYVLALENYERTAQLMQHNTQSTDRQAIDDLNSYIVNTRKLLKDNYE